MRVCGAQRERVRTVCCQAYLSNHAAHLCFALLINLEKAPAGQELLSDSSSAERQRGRSDGTSEVENSDFEEGEEQDDDDSYDESESSLDLQGEHFEEFAAATLSYFKRDGCVAGVVLDDTLLIFFPVPVQPCKRGNGNVSPSLQQWHGLVIQTGVLG